MSPPNLLCKYSRISDGAFLFGRTYIRQVGAVGANEWKKQEVRSISQNQLLDGLTHTPSVLSVSCVRLVSWCRAGLYGEVKAGNTLEPASDCQNM